MHLIGPLAAGIAGAASGTVGIFRRGTSTRATLYESFEATDGSSTPTADLTLDSNGRIVRYVGEVVDVVVKDVDGNEVTAFTDGASDDAVEVRSPSFTGVDYETAVSATGNPIALSAALDSWFTANGAVFGSVLLGGASTTLRAALGSFTGVFYNVQSSEYGAIGNGTTDDTSAIQEAIDACSAGGGGIVWFPEGTYRITADLSLPDKVSLWGPGAHCCTITVDHASENIVTTVGSTTRVWQEIRGIYFASSQANTGAHVRISTGTLLRVIGCSLGNSTSAGPIVYLDTSTTTIAVFEACSFTARASVVSAYMLFMAGAAKRLIATDCVFLSPGTNSTAALCEVNNCDFTRCRFDFSALSSGTVDGVRFNSTTCNGTVNDCVFTADAGAGVSVGIRLGTYVAASRFFESGNNFACDTAYAYTATAAEALAQVRLASRDTRVQALAVSATPVALETDQYGVIIATSSVAGNVTFTGTSPPVGARGVLTVNNSDGSTRNMVLSTGFTIVDNSSAVATNSSDEADYVATVLDPDSPVMRMLTAWHVNA